MSHCLLNASVRHEFLPLSLFNAKLRWDNFFLKYLVCMYYTHIIHIQTVIASRALVHQIHSLPVSV